MEVHPCNHLIMTQFIARVQMINLFHMILYHVTIGFSEIGLANMSCKNLGDLMNYHDTKTYGFDADHTITKICNETKQFGIDYGIQYDNSNAYYHNLLLKDHYPLGHSNQITITIAAISASYNTKYNRCRWQYIMVQQQQFQHHL